MQLNSDDVDASFEIALETAPKHRRCSPAPSNKTTCDRATASPGLEGYRVPLLLLSCCDVGVTVVVAVLLSLLLLLLKHGASSNSNGEPEAGFESEARASQHQPDVGPRDPTIDW